MNVPHETSESEDDIIIEFYPGAPTSLNDSIVEIKRFFLSANLNDVKKIEFLSLLGKLLPSDHYLDPSLYPQNEKKNDYGIHETDSDRYIILDIDKKVKSIIKHYNIQSEVSLSIFFDGGQKHKRSKSFKFWPFLGNVIANDFQYNHSVHQLNIILLGISSLKKEKLW